MIDRTHSPYETTAIVMYTDGRKPAQQLVTIENYKFSFTNFRKNKMVNSVLVELNLSLNYWKWIEFKMTPLLVNKKDTIYFTINDLT